MTTLGHYDPAVVADSWSLWDLWEVYYHIALKSSLAGGAS